MLLTAFVETSQRVAATRARTEKIALLAAFLKELSADEARIGTAWAAGELLQQKLGVGPSSLYKLALPAGAAEPTLTLLDANAVLTQVASVSGKGAGKERERLLTELMARATPAERDFLMRLLVSELRQGALAALLLEGVAAASGVPLDALRRAAMLGGSITDLAAVVLCEGAHALERYELRVFQPVLPMLAQPAEDVVDAIERLGEPAFETKLDGARVQVHKQGDEVRVFTRSLQDVTHALPEVVTLVRAMPAHSLVLDGEVIALRADGSPLPFQVTMRRFGRKLDVEALRAELPLSAFFFDSLLCDDRVLIDATLRERLAVLESVVPEGSRVPRLVTRVVADAEGLFSRVLAQGHEGLMAKSLEAPYDAGGRGGAWLKVKPLHTLDLVVLAVERGSGRRQGWLSNLHLGARDPRTGELVMLGKTFKGLTDELLKWQTEKLNTLALPGQESAYVVHVRPELVVEIAYSDLQASPRYPGGMALRFARVKRYRPDKSAAEADTIDTVRALFEKTQRA